MSDTAHTTVATLSFAGFTGGFARYVISPLVPEITASFGVTTSAIGFALSVM
jgi:predicted MFS family arabinose efflux permease